MSRLSEQIGVVGHARSRPIVSSLLDRGVGDRGRRDSLGDLGIVLAEVSCVIRRDTLASVRLDPHHSAGHFAGRAQGLSCLAGTPGVLGQFTGRDDLRADEDAGRSRVCPLPHGRSQSRLAASELPDGRHLRRAQRRCSSSHRGRAARCDQGAVPEVSASTTARVPPACISPTQGRTSRSRRTTVGGGGPTTRRDRRDKARQLASFGR